MKDNSNFLSTESKIHTEILPCICKHCGMKLDQNDAIKIESKDRVCYECYNKYYTTCEICGQVIAEDTLKNIPQGDEILEVCEDCYSKLNNLICAKDENRTFLYHHERTADCFVRFEFKVLLNDDLSPESFFAIIKDIEKICKVHSVPLLFIKESNIKSAIHIYTHYLSLDILRSSNVNRLLNYFTYTDTFNGYEILNICIEGTTDKADAYISELQTFLLKILCENKFSINYKQDNQNFTIHTGRITKIFNKYALYNVCIPYLRQRV